MPSWMDPMRVYLLHNEPDATVTLRPVVNQLGGLLRRVDSFRGLIEELQRRPDPDCVVASVFPGSECALEFLPVLKREFADLPVIIWSANLDVSSGVELMRLGANTVLEYPGTQPTLLLSLHQALHESGELRLRARREQELRARLQALTPGERDVMQLLFEGLTNQGIADRLAVSRRTVEARRQRIVKVAGVPNLIGLIVQLAQHGLLSQGPVPAEAESQPA